MKLFVLGRTATAVATAIVSLVSSSAAQTPAAAHPGHLGIDTLNFDRSIRPQDDFFRFANGSWLRTTEIPEDRSSYGSFVELDDASQEALKSIVEEAAAGDAPIGSVEQKVGDFYASFLDSATVERLGIAPLHEDLERIRGLSTTEQLPELFGYLGRLGVQTPISTYVTADGKNATRYVAYLSQSGLALPDRDYYLSDDPKLAAARAAYLTYAERLLDLAGEPAAQEGARKILELETSLARLHWERARNRDRDVPVGGRVRAGRPPRLSSGVDRRGSSGADRPPAAHGSAGRPEQLRDQQCPPQIAAQSGSARCRRRHPALPRARRAW